MRDSNQVDYVFSEKIFGLMRNKSANGAQYNREHTIHRTEDAPVRSYCLVSRQHTETRHQQAAGGEHCQQQAQAAKPLRHHDGLKDAAL